MPPRTEQDGHSGAGPVSEGTGDLTGVVAHRYRIEQALKQGKPVPKKVLADYPELVLPLVGE